MAEVTPPTEVHPCDCVCGHRHTMYYCEARIGRNKFCQCRVFRSVDGKRIQDVNGLRQEPIPPELICKVCGNSKFGHVRGCGGASRQKTEAYE